MPTPHPVTQNFTQILTKRRWSRSEAATAVQAWRDSAMSLHAFCERHGIDEQRLAHWAKNFPVAPKFAEVVVVGELPISKPSALVIELGQARVHVERDVDDEFLARVLCVVGSVC
jgi:transposase-like protein